MSPCCSHAHDSYHPFYFVHPVASLLQLKPKIDGWAAGKKDNIRALLASLHTVMWEGSGWSQPSMADMVEAGKVRENLKEQCSSGDGSGGSSAGRGAPVAAGAWLPRCVPATRTPPCLAAPRRLLARRTHARSLQVKRAYMKANLVVHPDKVKQKGGTLEQVGAGGAAAWVHGAELGKRANACCCGVARLPCLVGSRVPLATCGGGTAS